MINVLGEALVDLIAGRDGRTFTAHPGGSPANVALGLARLGVPATLTTHLGDDLFGAMVRAHLEQSGVDIRALPTRDTSLAFAATDEQGVARYDFRVTWDAERIPPARGFLHTGSLAALLGPAAVEAAMAAADTVSYDPNVRPSLSGPVAQERERVERQVSLADMVKVSEEDLAWLYPGADPHATARDWLDRGPRLVVVTLGANGAHAITASSALDRPGPRTTVVDTVGAGDAFTAGLLAWLTEADLLATPAEADLPALLDFANAVAAITCARAGANPPTREEVGRATNPLP
ncbi:carbohydrate kinase [Actinokineospora sp. NBRC 105648]|uniref:carbohydrate kinase family protein n=1 Tax=Actinokineospora sp. NBRC 105648 TaxID=3032206 RepID=UPI00249FA6E8|nr:carbohydrate kinase [Actinokineospora sp. NBRC 105648]GLZ42363.1 ribokinase [Actinokineospora sp. NBRC 105648]